MNTMQKARLRRRWRYRSSTLLIAVVLAGLLFSYWFDRQPLSIANLPDLRQRARIDVDAWKIVWNGSGDRVAILGWEKPVQVYDATTLWKTRTIGTGKKIIQFAFSPDQEIVAYCENHGFPQILNLTTGQTRTIDADEAGQHSLSFSPMAKCSSPASTGRKRLFGTSVPANGCLSWTLVRPRAD